MGPTITTKTSSAAAITTTTAITYDHDANITITTYIIYSLLLTAMSGLFCCLNGKVSL